MKRIKILGILIGVIILVLILVPHKETPRIVKSHFLGGSVSSSPTTVSSEPIVEYLVESNEVSQKHVYFDKNNPSKYSNAEVLPQRKDGQTPIAFYADPIVYINQGVIYDIKTATATLTQFNLLTKATLWDRLRSVFIDTAVATQTFSVSSTYTPDGTGTVTVLIVGGGGGGGGGGGPNFNAGGGGGQVIYITTSSVSSGTGYPVKVGIGGPGHDNADGDDGTTSSFNGIVAQGGFGAKVANAAGGNSGNGVFTGGADSGPGGGGAGDSENGHLGGTGFPGSDGGLGTSSTISGTDTCYGGGGAGNASIGSPKGRCGGGNQGVSTPSNGGGGQGSDLSTGPIAGAKGIIIISFNSTTPAVFKPRVEDLYIE